MRVFEPRCQRPACRPGHRRAPRRSARSPGGAAAVRAVAARVDSRRGAAIATRTAALRPGVERMEWDALAQAVADCRACAVRRAGNTVFGVGDRQADWLIVGEAPGEERGPAGRALRRPGRQLLDNMLKALGLDRQQQGLHHQRAEVPAARQPQSRAGGGGAMRALPAPPGRSCCSPKSSWPWAASRCRRCWAAQRADRQAARPGAPLRGVPLVVTYHPAYLLRNLPDKAKAWADLCLAQQLLSPG